MPAWTSRARYSGSVQGAEEARQSLFAINPKIAPADHDKRRGATRDRCESRAAQQGKLVAPFAGTWIETNQQGDTMTTWTTEMDDMLRAEHTNTTNSSSTTAAVLSRAFNMDLTRNAVIGRKNRLGLCRKRNIRSAPRPETPPKPRIERRSNRVMTSKLVSFPQIEYKPPIVVDDVPKHKMGTFSFSDLKPTSCRWPYGDAPYLFCGLTICADDQNHSYCQGHALKAYTKPTQRVRAQPFYRRAA